MTKDLPSPETLRKLLRYDAATGKLFWLHRTPDMFDGGKYSAERACLTWNAKHAGRQALSAINDLGYLYGHVFKKKVRSHRAVWALVFGAWPDGEIDHRNGDPQDNRLENLRVATPSQNSRNQRINSANTSGIKGVSFSRAQGKWVARLRIDGGKLWSKEFTTKEDASLAIAAARVKFHGDFARHA